MNAHPRQSSRIVFAALLGPWLATASAADKAIYPGKDWQRRTPAEAGLDAVRLEAFSRFVGGRGCVVRGGYLVDSWGNLSKRGDVASACKPWFTHLLLTAVEEGKIGSLDEKVVRWEPRLAELNKATTSPLPATLTRTGGKPAEMIAGQRSLGGGSNQSDHFGSYSWLWWTNGTDRDGKRMWPDAPRDMYGAFGHGGQRALWVIPRLDLVVSYNDARLSKWTNGEASETNQAARELVQAVLAKRQVGNDDGASPLRRRSDVPGSPDEKQSRHKPVRQTEVSIDGEKFFLNGKPTYEGRTWRGHKVEGLLLNSRMVQATFDDLNEATRGRWAYPDTGRWDAERNTREFLAAMPTWRKHGLLALTLNLQGGSPHGYSKDQPWYNSTIRPDGSLRAEYMGRLERVLDRADELGMVVILGLFYFGQDERLKDEAAVEQAVDNAVDWILERGYRQVLIEVNNECNVRYDHAILRPARVHALIERVKARRRGERRLLAGTSYGGGTIPEENVVRASDFLLLHGNGVGDPRRIAEMVRRTRAVAGYRPMPILFNEDDHYDFDKPENNLAAAVGQYASWGFFDFRREKEGFAEGYQSVPVDWGISSERKRAFFKAVQEITGAKASAKEE